MNLRPPGYEPGELPDCSTPRRGGEYSPFAARQRRRAPAPGFGKRVASIARMPLPFWIALGVLVVAIVVGAFHVYRQARAFMRTFKAFSGEMDRTLEKLNSSLEQLERNSDELGSSTPKLEASISRLKVSLARAAVLQAAAQDVLDSVGRLTAVYPSK